MSLETAIARVMDVLPPTPPAVAEMIREAAARIKPHEASFSAKMEHLLHAGMYARTCRVPAGMAFTSVLIKVPTVLVIHGDCFIFAGDTWRRSSGYHVAAAAAGRMQAYVTVSETEITMIFPSRAKTVEEAEAEFTDEGGQLLSRRRPEDDLITITSEGQPGEERACQE